MILRFAAMVRSCFALILLAFLLRSLPTSAQQSGKSASTLPLPDHVVVLILENHHYTSIIGSADAPYINALANDPNAALFTNSFAITHPSQPNYLALFSGSTQGVADDSVPHNYPFITPNLARELMDASRSFATYSEDLPYAGYDGATYGNYARKHNPVANWVGTGTNQVPDTVNRPFTDFPSSDFAQLPTVAFIVPNQSNDMHTSTGSASIIAGDNWLHSHLDTYLQWALSHNSLFILTFDEDDDHHDNQVTTIFYGPMVQGGQYADLVDHYTMLRTIEELYSLPLAGNTASYSPIYDCWRSAGLKNLNSSGESLLSVFPNPTSETATFRFNNRLGGHTLSITDLHGHALYKHNTLSGTLTIPVSAYPDGLYFYSVTSTDASPYFGRLIVRH
ncbi:MAG: T9SS type A sorting domain-containing protein [Bacteroidetes bacterium]|nr:T9SS type A sorting domain-containing protein [Bacteroidota bacterium]